MEGVKRDGLASDAIDVSYFVIIEMCLSPKNRV